MARGSERLVREAEKPQTVTVPGLSVSRHSLRDQIDLDKHLARKRAAKSKLGGIKLVRTRPPAMG